MKKSTFALIVGGVAALATAAITTVCGKKDGNTGDNIENDNEEVVVSEESTDENVEN